MLTSIGSMTYQALSAEAYGTADSEPDQVHGKPNLSPLVSRIDAADMESLLRTEFIDDQIVFLIDSSQVMEFEILADAMNWQRSCLFGEQAHEEYGHSAPYLVNFQPARDRGGDLLWEFFSQGNALILRSSANLERLRISLKRFLRIVLDGKVHFMKFYRAGNFEYCLDLVPELRRIFADIDVLYVAAFDLRGGLNKFVKPGAIT
jgi:Domain of unknown function (DUF4123)